MATKFIEIGEAMPIPVVSDELQNAARSFSFDNEEYRAALLETGVPEPALDTLELRMNYDSHLHSHRVIGVYAPDQHRLQVLFSPGEITSQPAKGAWASTDSASPLSVSDAANFVLAREAQRMADFLTKQSDAVAVERIKRNGFGRIVAGLTGSFAVAGAIAGERVLTDTTPFAEPLASVVQGITGASFGIATAFFATNRRTNREYRQVEAHNKVTRERAEAFAQSPRARELFDRVVSLEWAE